ncbi:AAA family ATPase [Coleofasciculus sp. FACHB-1120]|uniref:ATP-dependent nuclease n=1 Tax=Coleofasciculus sp. FACHB-1120 TaxID=2692783 RepID=UPI0016841663|nr:AAA family ATPase [Coleofasciculus sp. FACHB-1120]MBD2742342.1 AAA family ATPase [Coleofasciculus sp. FACHB-1120]
MWVSKVELSNFRSFVSASVGLSKGINLVIGPNNSGKSTLLKSVAWVQYGSSLSHTDLRLSQKDGFVQIELNNIKQFFPESSELNKVIKVSLSSPNNIGIEFFNRHIHIQGIPGELSLTNTMNTFSFYSYSIPNQEPENFIYPYLSRRKVATYEEMVNLNSTSSVRGNFSNLYAKIDRLSNPEMPANKQYVQACREILGFQITAIPSEQGKKAAYVVSNFESIPLEAMGEGIANLVGLIVDLCIANNQLFLIEEPENDVHPKALKKLLKLIAEKAETNQFIITTHSNIVVKYLGSQSESKLFRVTMEFEDRLPTSEIEEVGDSSEARLHVLEELGYELFDFDIWSAWLILEESTAEKIIREFLIPWFTPELKDRIRTFSARSVNEVETKFEDFNKLFVFLHLQPIYKNLAWVIIDGGDEEKKVIERLKRTYTSSGWGEDHFLQFSKHDFERYYPQKFQSKIDSVLQMPNSKSRQGCKKALLHEVEAWIKENPELAKTAFKESASEVVQMLHQIESALVSYKE